jgi:hypothetical protein
MLKPFVAIILLAVLLLAQVPFSGPAAGAQPGQVTLDWSWDRPSGVSETAIRNDERPSVDGAGNAYVTPENGYLYCVKPDGETKWKLDLHQPGEYKYTGGKRPVIDSAGNCYIGSGDGNLYAVSPAGQVLWKYKMNGEVAPGTSPAFSPDGKTIYVADINLYLYAVGLDGTGRWKFRFSGSNNSNTPVVAPDGTIYVGSATIIQCINPDGTGKWLKALGSYSTHRFSGAYSGDAWKGDQRMAVDNDGTLYLAVSNKAVDNKNYLNTLLALNASDGSYKWRLDVDQVLSAPAVDGDTLYYKTANNRLHALDLGSPGDGGVPVEKWSYKAQDELYYSDTYLYDNEPLVTPDGTVIVPMGHSLHAVGTDGGLRWSTPDAGYPLGAVSPYGPGGQLYCVRRGNQSGTNSMSLLKFTDHGYAPAPAELEITEGDFSLLPGGAYRIAPAAADGYGRTVERVSLDWESDAPAVASVDATGLVTARSAGTARITARGADNPGAADTVTVTVLPGTEGLTLRVTPAEASVVTGGAVTLQAALLGPGDAAVLGEPLEWTSSLGTAAQVDGSGCVSGLKPGKTEIRARLQRYPAVTGKSSVTVGNPEVRRITPEEIESALNKTVSWYKTQGAPTDWAAFGLNAAGQDISQSPYLTGGETYLQRLEAKVLATGMDNQMTDPERTVMGVVSAGGDPRDFAGIDLIDKIVTWPGMGQGINAAIWGLIALDAANAPDPAGAGLHTRNEFIAYILNNKSGDGWAFGGGAVPDPDMTGMGLYALAPYRDRADVKAAGEKAIAWLSSNQNDDGKFGSWGSINAESCAQSIMGITSWGVDPQGPAFTKSLGNAVTGLLSFQASSGMFRHTTVEDPGMATDQSLEALAALKRYNATGTNTIFYKIQAAGSPVLGEITSLEVYPDGLVLEPGKTLPLQAKNQAGTFVPGELVDWQVSDPSRAELIPGGQGGASVKALSPGEVNITVSLKDSPAIKDQGQLTVVGTDFTIEKTEPDPSTGGGSPGKRVAARLTNVSGAGRQSLVIITFYRLDTQEVAHQSFVSGYFLPGEANKVTGYYHVPPEEADRYGVKVMIWDGWQRARPLAGAILE